MTVSNQSTALHQATALLGSGCVSTTVGFPLESLRIRLLFGNQIGATSTLGRGLVFSQSLSVIKTGCIWPLQEMINKYLAEQKVSGVYSTIISGGISNLLPNTILAPFSITKVHLMRDYKRQSWIAVSYNIYRLNGVMGFYKGNSATMLRDAAWGMIYFPAYELFNQQIRQHVPKSSIFANDMTSTFAGAVTASILTSWIDAIRLHMMNQDRIAHESFSKLVRCALAPTKANILSTSMGVLRVGICTSIAHTSYNAILRYLKK